MGRTQSKSLATRHGTCELAFMKRKTLFPQLESHQDPTVLQPAALTTATRRQLPSCRLRHRTGYLRPDAGFELILLRSVTSACIPLQLQYRIKEWVNSN